MTERVYTFGEGGGLLGFVSLPEGGSAGEPQPLFAVILNSGLVHRAGPFRMGVDLARRLADAGIATLRFDLSGLGDSAVRGGHLSDEERIVADCRDALDFLSQRFGAHRFVMVGLCSGAMNAHRVTLADPRIAGMVLLDGYAYPTSLYYRYRLGHALRRPDLAIKSLYRHSSALVRSVLPAASPLAVAVPAAAGPALAVDLEPAAAIHLLEWPSVRQVRPELEQMLARGCRALYVYTQTWTSFVDVRQFDEFFPDLPHRERIEVHYLGEADHTYIQGPQRARMFELVTSFVRSFR